MPLDPRLALAGVPAIVEPFDLSRPLIAASNLRSAGLNQQLVQAQLAERQQAQARQEQIRRLYALDQPQTSAAPSEPGPLVENGQVVPPRVGEGLSPQLAQQPQQQRQQQPQVPLWRQAMAIDPATGLKLRQGLAEAESAEQKARDERLAYMGQVAYGVLQENTQAAYDEGVAHLRQTFGNEFVDTLNLPGVYDPDGVRRFYNRSLSAQARQQTQEKVSLDTRDAFDAQGNPVLIQPTSTGVARQTQLPAGVTLQPKTREIDRGTVIETVDAAGRVVRTVPKELYEQERLKKSGEVSGKEEAERPAKMRQAQTAIRQLEVQHDRVTKMLDEAEGLADAWTTGMMSLPMTALRGTRARRLAGVIRSIQANLGITELQTLKGAGVSLGQVTEAEHALIQRLYGELQQAETAADVKRTIQTFRDELKSARGLRSEAYERDFGTARSRSEAGPAPGASQPTRDLSALSPEKQQRYQELRQKYGGR